MDDAFVKLQPKECLLNQAEFRKALGSLSNTTLWRLQKEGIVPKPLKLGRNNYYKASWVDEVIERLEKEAAS